MDQISIHLNLTRDDLRRIRRLKENLFDLDVAIGDLDDEIASRLTERERLATLLFEAEAELALLIRRAA